MLTLLQLIAVLLLALTMTCAVAHALELPGKLRLPKDVITQPVNRVWLKHQQLGRAGSAFFGSHTDRTDTASQDWTVLRNRWEGSHVARAALATTALMLLTTAIAVG